MFRLKGLFGARHDERTDESYVQAYALADGTYLYQGRCSCGWYSDVYLEERLFVEDLHEVHQRTGQ